MAKNSVCSACGMTMEGEKKFCSACGSPMTVQEIPDAAPEMNTMNDSVLPEEPAAPAMDNNMNDMPSVDSTMDSIPPVPPMDDTMGSVPPYSSPVDNGMGASPYNSFGGNVNMNMGMQPQESQSNAKDGLAIAGMVVGILSVLLICMNWIGILVGVVGLILSILGIKSIRRKGMATAGIICSVVGLLGSILVLILSLFVINEAFEMTEAIVGNESEFEAFMEDYEDIFDNYDDYEYEYHYEWE